MITTILDSSGITEKLSLKKILHICVILSSLLYGTMVTVIQVEGYDFNSQSVSELSAIGAPTRSLWIPLGITYQVLMIAFGAGVWLSAENKISLRIVASLILLGFKISIHGETNVLKRIFGEEYEKYVKSVNEIIPFPRYFFR